MQTLWIAATTGLVEPSATLIRVCSVGSVSAFGELNSLMSAPPENALPAPVMTIALTASSASALRMPSTAAVRVARPSPLTGGLFRVMTATLPLTWYSALMSLPLLVEPAILQLYINNSTVVLFLGALLKTAANASRIHSSVCPPAVTARFR